MCEQMHADLHQQTHIHSPHPLVPGVAIRGSSGSLTYKTVNWNSLLVGTRENCYIGNSVSPESYTDSDELNENTL